MNKVESRIQRRLKRAKTSGLVGIYVWSPTQEEIAAFAGASSQGDWSAEGERLRLDSLQMLGESLPEEGSTAWLKLVVGIEKSGRVVAFGLLDEDNVEHGFELITLASEEGRGFGSALLLAAAKRTGGQDLFLNAGTEAEGYYDTMGLEGGDGWRTWSGATCTEMTQLLEASGVPVYESAPTWSELVVELV